MVVHFYIYMYTAAKESELYSLLAFKIFSEKQIIYRASTASVCVQESLSL